MAQTEHEKQEALRKVEIARAQHREMRRQLVVAVLPAVVTHRPGEMTTKEGCRKLARQACKIADGVLAVLDEDDEGV